MKITILLTLLSLIVYCKAKPVEEDNGNVALALLLSSATSNCPVTSPFSSLVGSGTSGCGNSGCHNSTDLAGGMNIADYASVKSKVVVNKPEESLLYQKITTGSMQGNSNPTINSAIYCWISKGAEP